MNYFGTILPDKDPMADKIKESFIVAIKQLYSMGIEVHMVTGFLLNPMIAEAVMTLNSASVATNSLRLRMKPL